LIAVTPENGGFARRTFGQAERWVLHRRMVVRTRPAYH
jgi:hypothetical protein